MIFLFRSDSDSSDRYEQLVYEFAEEVIQQVDGAINDFSSHGDLNRFKNDLNEFDGSVCIHAAFLAYCHGSSSKLAIISSDDISINLEDARIFRNKFCYFVSCSSLKGLGKAMKDAGALGVVGYERPVIVLFTDYADGVESIKRCVNSGIMYWLQHGGSSEEICNVMKKAYDKELQRLDGITEFGTEILPVYGALRANRSSLGYL